MCIITHKNYINKFWDEEKYFFLTVLVILRVAVAKLIFVLTECKISRPRLDNQD